MTLVDTSVWVNHFRAPEAGLIKLLNEGQAGIHPFIIGELAAGNLKTRSRTLAEFQKLPRTEVAGEQEVHHFLEQHRLYGLGLGWVDLHLLAGALLSGWNLWTADSALQKASRVLGVDS